MVETTGAPLSVELGPGIIENIYDGIQRPLEGIMKKAGSNNLPRGVEVPALDREKKWQFNATVQPGAKVIGGDVIGTVQETSVVLHKIMIPPKMSGTIESIQSGSFTVLDTVAVLVDDKREKHELTMVQTWPVRVGHFCTMVRSCFSPLSSTSTATVSSTVNSPDWMDSMVPLILGGIMILWRMESVS